MVFSNVNVNLYKSFIAVYENKSISRAAAELSLTQPTVTHNIKELERQLAIKLFHTHPRGVECTKEASELYNHVVQAFRILKNGEMAITDFGTDTTATIRIACTSLFAENMLAEFIQEFARKYPSVVFQTQIMLDGKATDELAKFNIDLMAGLCAVDAPQDVRFKGAVIGTYNSTFFAGKGFAKDNAIESTIDKDKFINLPLVALAKARRRGSEFDAVDAIKAGNFEVDTMESMVNFVGRGMGVGYGTMEHLAAFPGAQFTKFAVDKVELPKLQLVVNYNQDSINKPTKAFFDGLCRHFKVSE